MRNFIDLFNDTQTVSPTPASQPSSLLLMEQQALLEGKHFEAMFSTLEALGQRYHEDHILEKVAAAKEAIRLLRKSDRQAWAARIIRLWLFDRIAGWSVSDFNGSIGIYDQHDDATKVQKTEQYHAFIGEVKRLQAKYQGEYQKIMGEPYVASNDDPALIIKRKIVYHFLGMPYSKIQGYQFGSKSLPVVLQELEALEDEFKTRTKAALTAAKARGVKLGNPHLLARCPVLAARAREAQRMEARRRKEAVLPYLEQARTAGAVTLWQLADALMKRGVQAPRGGHRWHPAQVRRLLDAAQKD
ncbi:MAG: hypothetical protein EOO77_23220 [Oxalobacteraceae bacterium]|nr:MAG: hypothetical protein EOO77_23220 [Oxalobacteraceae bacterium]